ncbi:ABC transporter permease [Oceanirhabdus sp. W0125-5]|uniref:ABC transporter permease n=1 Tax=Oceanirhabdus sp. W0125-5 TaxID=2999116 RepID=UPI0022F2D673|nr:ABC transporter permease [Oceanirhabdus sp. W0125-5]WBW96293.1 ABC transporter permease [Oceanirhabdus sp. W0125-5]
MINLIRADLFKMRKSKAIKVLCAISTVSAVIMAVMAYMIPQGKIHPDFAELGFMFSDISMIAILGAVMAGVLICGDFSNKTIHDAVATGSSRSTVIVSKGIVFLCAIGCLLLPYIIVIGIGLSSGSEFSMGNSALGFLNLLTTNAGTVLSASEIGKLLAVIFTLIIVYMAQLSICVPLAFVIKKPGFLVGLNYGVSMLSGQLTGFRESSKLFKSIFDCTPFGGKYVFITLDTGIGYIFKAIAVSLIFIIIMFFIAYRTFRRAEIK